MKLVHRFIQVGFPEDGHTLNLRILPHWNSSDRKLKKNSVIHIPTDTVPIVNPLYTSQPSEPLPSTVKTLLPSSSTSHLSPPGVQVNSSSFSSSSAQSSDSVSQQQHSLSASTPPPLPPRSPSILKSSPSPSSPILPASHLSNLPQNKNEHESITTSSSDSPPFSMSTSHSHETDLPGTLASLETTNQPENVENTQGDMSIIDRTQYLSEEVDPTSSTCILSLEVAASENEVANQSASLHSSKEVLLIVETQIKDTSQSISKSDAVSSGPQRQSDESNCEEINSLQDSTSLQACEDRTTYMATSVMKQNHDEEGCPSPASETFSRSPSSHYGTASQLNDEAPCVNETYKIQTAPCSLLVTDSFVENNKENPIEEGVVELPAVMNVPSSSHSAETTNMSEPHVPLQEGTLAMESSSFPIPLPTVPPSPQTPSSSPSQRNSGSQSDPNATAPSSTTTPPPLFSPAKPVGVITENKSPHPVEYSYTPTLIDVYPKEIEADSSVQNMPMFCFPDNMKIVESPSGPPPITHHTFVLTNDDGSKLHCACLILWEKPSATLLEDLERHCVAWNRTYLTPSDLEYISHLRRQIHTQHSHLVHAQGNEDTEAIHEKLGLFTELLQPFTRSAFVDLDHVYVPRALCLSSSWPIYGFMEDYLKCVYTGIMDTNGTTCPLEACLVNVMHEIPFPPPGRKEIGVLAHSQYLYFSRPAPNEISALKNFSFHPLFRSLEIPDILFVMECILNEKKIVFFSEYPSMLNSCIQTLILLLFPFNWFHVLIPVLPISLLPYLEAPVPFIVGILRCHKPLCEEWLSEVVLCDLDESCVYCPTSVQQNLIPLPQHHRHKLLVRLRKACRLPATGPPLNMRETFPLAHVEVYCKSVVAAAPSTLSPPPPPSAAQVTISPPSKRSSSAASSPFLPIPHTQAATTTTNPTLSPSHPAVFLSTQTTSSLLTLPTDTTTTTPTPVTTSPSSIHSTRFSFRHLPSKPPFSPLKSSVEGHSFVELGMSMKSGVCAFCDALHQPVYKCTGCGMSVHADCFASILGWCPKAFQEPMIRVAFLKLFVGFFKSYRMYVTSKNTFDVSLFLNDTVIENKPFLSMFVETQAFAQFLQDRFGSEDANSDYEVIFFDEMIKAKNTRTLIPFNKLHHSNYKEFFSDRSFEVKSTHFCLAPEPPVNSILQVYTRFPLTSSDTLSQLQPRLPPSLVNPQEELMLALYTAKMSRQAKHHAKVWTPTTWKGFKFTDPETVATPVSTTSHIDASLRFAWETFNEAQFQTAVSSRNDFQQRKSKLLAVQASLHQSQQHAREQSDMEHIQLVIAQIDKWLKHIEDEFHQTFLDDKTFSEVQPPPTLSVYIPAADIDFPQGGPGI